MKLRRRENEDDEDGSVWAAVLSDELRIYVVADRRLRQYIKSK